MYTDVETIERATVEGVAPLRVEELPGWLLPLDRGGVNRAISAVPLHHGVHAPGVLAPISERYQAHGLSLQLRLADVPGLSALQLELTALGIEPARPTYMQCIDSAHIAARVLEPDVVVASAADDGWNSVFHRVAFSHGSPSERAARLARAPTTLYATLRADDVPVSVGALTFARGLACVHSMRTHEAERGRGYATRVLGALAHAARQRGVQHLILQVEEESTAARALYAKLGFSTLWRYRYWRRAATTSHQSQA